MKEFFITLITVLYNLALLSITAYLIVNYSAWFLFFLIFMIFKVNIR